MIPLLSVRTEAARILSRSPPTLFGSEDLRLFRKVFRELKQRYTHNLDRPESHLSLGILAENQGIQFWLRNTTGLQLNGKVHLCPPG